MYLTLSLSLLVQFQEIPGSLKDSKLCVWPLYSRDPPSSFAWLTGAGVYYSTLAFGDQEPGETLFIEKNLIPYPKSYYMYIYMYYMYMYMVLIYCTII